MSEKTEKSRRKKRKLTQEQAVAQLWEIGDLSYKLKGIQKEMRDIVYESEHDITIYLVSRQTGKCLVEGTKVSTPYGSKSIEDIEVGDIVYGFNEKGQIEETEVKQVHNQGLKEVVELTHRGRVIAECTMDHRWLAWDSYKKEEKVVTTKQLLTNKRLKISRRYFNTGDNHKKNFCGVSKGKTSIKQTYDIGIDNGTHLYALANGLITHNSFTMCLIATEYCQRHPNTRVLLMFPKKNMATSVAKEQMRIIHEDCPEHLKPEHKIADKEFVYPNGSIIMMAGADAGHAESVRGKTIHLILCDEAGFFPYNDMQYIVNSILMPTLTTTNGKMIIASTPSKEPDHFFMTGLVEPYRSNGWLIEYDINANPLIDDNMRAKILARYPLGEEDPEYQREYLLKTKVSNSLMAIPEWYDIEVDIVKASERPLFTDNYVSMDPAVVDGTGIIFAYYDYPRKKLVIEDELFLGGDDNRSLTTQEIADGIVRKEGNLFRNRYTGELSEPYMRVSDNNLPLLINDLNSKHNIHFITTKKDGKEDKVNEVRMLMKRGNLEIHPRCKILIAHIQTAKWKANRKEFVRNKGDISKGIKSNHSDLLDALVYLVRNYHPHRNPYPNGYFDLQGENVHNSGKYQKPDENKDFMMAIMNNKKK